jgi:drug/metabolite transporter (DMT)-like permease
MDEMGPLRAVAWSCLVGWALLLPGAVAEDVFVHLGDISALGWLCVVHLGFLGSGVAYVWYFKGIRDVGATRAAVFINLVPALAIGLGMLLLGERLLLIEIFGAVCAMLGVWLVNRARTTT